MEPVCGWNRIFEIDGLLKGENKHNFYLMKMHKFQKLFPKVLISAFILGATVSTQAGSTNHGKITTLSAASSKDYERCAHKVPKEVCTRCNPQLVPKFKDAKDWCGEHGLPESQ